MIHHMFNIFEMLHHMMIPVLGFDPHDTFVLQSSISLNLTHTVSELLSLSSSPSLLFSLSLSLSNSYYLSVTLSLYLYLSFS